MQNRARNEKVDARKPDDSRLDEAIRLAQQGEHTAFEYIYRLHCKRVYALCLRMLRDASEAEDLTQEVFLQLFRKIHTFRGESAEITEVWRRGSVIASWLLNLTASALLEEPTLEKFSGRVSDSGEGRWTLLAAIDESVPSPVLSAALFQRFSSRGEDEFAQSVLSAMRYQFGGHTERAAGA